MPKYIPGVIFSFWLSTGLSAARERNNAYEGKKIGCQCRGLESNLYLLNICVGVGVKRRQWKRVSLIMEDA